MDLYRTSVDDGEWYFIVAWPAKKGNDTTDNEDDERDDFIRLDSGFFCSHWDTMVLVK